MTLPRKALLGVVVLAWPFCAGYIAASWVWDRFNRR